MMMASTANAAMPLVKHQQQQDHTTTKKSSSGSSAKKVFLNKRFYLHFKCRANQIKASDVIKVFGGQIDEFLEKQPDSYLLTDIPTTEWPPEGKDPILQRGINHGLKIMSFQNLINYCREYLLSQSSSDEDEELTVQATELRGPFIKFEDIRCKYAPSVKELTEWPEINLDGPLLPGQTIFGFNPAHTTTHPTPTTPKPTSTPKQTSIAWPNNSVHPRTRQQHSVQPTTPKTLVNPNVAARVLRRNATYCELCGLRVAPELLEEHLDSPDHKSNCENAKWGEVESVIDSLPALDSLITRKRVQLNNLDEHQEFLCLHKVETISQMFPDLKQMK